MGGREEGGRKGGREGEGRMEGGRKEEGGRNQLAAHMISMALESVLLRERERERERGNKLNQYITCHTYLGSSSMLHTSSTIESPCRKN